MIHPTQRAALMVGAGAPVMLVAALAAPQSWVYGLAFLGAALALIAMDGLVVLLRHRVESQVTCPAMLHIGETEHVTVRLMTSRATPVEIGLDLEGPVHPVAQISGRTQGGVESHHVLDVETFRRGIVKLHALWLRIQGPFGLVARTLKRPLDLESAIVPNIAAVKRDALNFSASDAPIGSKRQHQKGTGTEFDALRDYVAGLDSRSIDWKHSARHRRLVCKEFQTERNHNIILALDTGHLMSEPIEGVPKLDHAITALLLLSYVSLMAGDRVGVYGFDARAHTFTAPAGGTGVLPRIQHAFSALDYSTEETNFTLALAELGGRLRRRSLVIVASDFVDTVTAELMIENVTHLARRHVVVFLALREPSLEQRIATPPNTLEDVAGAVVAHDLLRDRREVFMKLERMGVMCLEAPVGRLGPDLVNRYLAIKMREMI